MALQFATRARIRASILKDPLRFPLLASLDGTEAVQCQAEADAYQPTSKTRSFAQPPEPPIGPEQRLLRNVLCIGVVPQHTPSHAKSQWRAFSKQSVPFALSKLSAAFFVASLHNFRFGSDRRQDPLLHEIIAASRSHSALLVHMHDAAMGQMVHFWME